MHRNFFKSTLVFTMIAIVLFGGGIYFGMWVAEHFLTDLHRPRAQESSATPVLVQLLHRRPCHIRDLGPRGGHGVSIHSHHVLGHGRP
jgi:hypothetical protein